MKNYNTFISYSSTNGANEATLIYYALRERGISVFMDVRQKESGKFPARITKILENCDNFILIVAKNTMEACRDANNFTRKEIVLAHQLNKNIILIEFPEAKTSYNNLSSDDELKEVKLNELQSIKYIHEQSEANVTTLLTYLKNTIIWWDCIDLLLKSLDLPAKAKKLGEFILGSSEWRLSDNSEVHILTNDFQNYDLTVIGKMLISTNLIKNIKYVYYCPKECEVAFTELHGKLNGYIIKNKDARNEVDRWIRVNYIANSKIIFWLNTINKKDINTIKSYFFTSINEQHFDNIAFILKKLLKTDLQSNITLVDITSLLEWINGNFNMERVAEPIITYFNDIVKIVEQLNIPHNHILNEWKSNCFLLSNLLKASKWINNQDLNLEEDSLTFLNQINVDNQIINWLMQDSLSAEENNAIENLYFYKLDEDNLPIRCCYSFSLLLCPDGSIQSSGWYKASTRTDKYDIKENTLLINGLGNSEKQILKTIFMHIINHDAEFKSRLNSVIFK